MIDIFRFRPFRMRRALIKHKIQTLNKGLSYLGNTLLRPVSAQDNFPADYRKGPESYFCNIVTMQSETNVMIHDYNGNLPIRSEGKLS